MKLKEYFNACSIMDILSDKVYAKVLEEVSIKDEKILTRTYSLQMLKFGLIDVTSMHVGHDFLSNIKERLFLYYVLDELLSEKKGLRFVERI